MYILCFFYDSVVLECGEKNWRGAQILPKKNISSGFLTIKNPLKKKTISDQISWTREKNLATKGGIMLNATFSLGIWRSRGCKPEIDLVFLNPKIKIHRSWNTSSRIRMFEDGDWRIRLICVCAMRMLCAYTQSVDYNINIVNCPFQLFVQQTQPFWTQTRQEKLCRGNCEDCSGDEILVEHSTISYLIWQKLSRRENTEVSMPIWHSLPLVLSFRGAWNHCVLRLFKQSTHKKECRSSSSLFHSFFD